MISLISHFLQKACRRLWEGEVERLKKLAALFESGAKTVCPEHVLYDAFGGLPADVACSCNSASTTTATTGVAVTSTSRRPHRSNDDVKLIVEQLTLARDVVQERVQHVLGVLFFGERRVVARNRSRFCSAIVRLNRRASAAISSLYCHRIEQAQTVTSTRSSRLRTTRSVKSVNE